MLVYGKCEVAEFKNASGRRESGEKSACDYVARGGGAGSGRLRLTGLRCCLWWVLATGLGSRRRVWEAPAKKWKWKCWEDQRPKTRSNVPRNFSDDVVIGSSLPCAFGSSAIRARDSR